MRAAAVEPRSGGPALVRLVALLCVMSLRSVTAQGAAGAVLTGTVTDRESGAGVGGAVVLLRNTLLTARTDEMGRFRLSAVPAGRYTLKVLAIGYATDSLVGLSISEGEQAPVTVLLRSVPVGLADVVVTASRAPEGSSESGASVTMLSAQELSSRNVTTLDQALQFEPGVTFNAGQMDIRGSTGLARGVGSRVLLMLDGHPILSGDGGEIDFESLPLLDVDRVEVVKGAYSAGWSTSSPRPSTTDRPPSYVPTTAPGSCPIAIVSLAARSTSRGWDSSIPGGSEGSAPGSSSAASYPTGTGRTTSRRAGWPG